MRLCPVHIIHSFIHSLVLSLITHHERKLNSNFSQNEYIKLKLLPPPPPRSSQPEVMSSNLSRIQVDWTLIITTITIIIIIVIVFIYKIVLYPHITQLNFQYALVGPMNRIDWSALVVLTVVKVHIWKKIIPFFFFLSLSFFRLESKWGERKIIHDPIQVTLSFKFFFIVWCPTSAINIS